MATSLYHPDTVLRSYEHSGDGAEPGLKDPAGNWDVRPHRSRLITVNDETLTTWHAILEGDKVPPRRSRMVYTVNRSVAAVLDKLAAAPRIGSLGLEFSQGWNETTDFKKGYFEAAWGAPDSWDDVILQGPHLHVATPLYKTPNETMLHNRDWSPADFERLEENAVPITAYKPSGDRTVYDAAYTRWKVRGEEVQARNTYRVAWRNMAANTGERTLTPAIIPPGAAHVNAVMSATVVSGGRHLAILAAALSSLISDAAVRMTSPSTVNRAVVMRLGAPDPIGPLADLLIHRTLRLNCVTSAYSNLWSDCYRESFATDSWTGEAGAVCGTSETWSSATPLRLARDRRQALIELDSLVALALGLTAHELCTVYRTQFPVLLGYDQSDFLYDKSGRLVPNLVRAAWRKKGNRISTEERTATNQAGNTYTYELPFATLNREADMRQAYAEFERRLAERS